jgi:large subunit ribosomal protein L10
VNRTEKEETVAALHKVFEGSNLVLVAQYSGLTVAQMNDLRGRMKDVGAGLKVTKNRLTRLALEGTKFKPLADLFKGPTVVAFGTDPVGAAKAAVSFAKDNDKLIIRGGALDAQTLDEEGIKSLASLPSLDELRAKLVGMISTPATRIAGVLQAPAGQLARVFNAYATKDEAA